MKRAALLFSVAVLATPMVVAAQSASGSISATATVLAYVDVEHVADLDFGAIAAGDAATLTPGTTPADGSLGALRIDHNSEVSVSVALPTGGLSLVGGSGTEPKLPVSFTCGYSVNPSGALDGSATNCSALANRAGSVNGSMKSSYIQIGGSIASGETTSRIPGTYTGSLVFTVNAVY